MISEPLVSVCTPVYNGEEFLEDCIKGVLKQTYRNIEYIIVDNASTDKTSLIIEKYRKIDSRVKVFKNERTVPMIENLNLCAKQCSDNAKWIKYALADDYLFPNCVEEMVKVGELDEQIGIISAYRLYGNQLTNRGLSIDQNVFNGAEILKKQLLRKLHVVSSSPNSNMYKKKVFFELKCFDTKLMHCDTELAFRIIDKYKIGFVHYVLTRTGLHQGRGESYSITHGITLMEYMGFGYKQINNYKTVSFNDEELYGLKSFYASKIMDFLVTKFAYLEWRNICVMLKNTPLDIKRELKKTLFRNLRKYIIIYFKSIFRIKSYLKNRPTYKPIKSQTQ